MAVDKKWLVFYVSSRAEKKVASGLQNMGLEVFLPLVSTVRQWSDRKKKVELPLFPGYIFVKESETQVSKISAYPGVVCPLKIAGNYGVIRPEEIDAIHRLLEFGASAEAEPGKIPPGEKVIIDEGPMRGITGVCIEQAGERHILVQIEALNHFIKVKIPSGAVRLKSVR